MLVEERRRVYQAKTSRSKRSRENQPHAPGTNELLVQHAVVLLWVSEVIFCSS